jgi:hypothetical protein
MRKRPTELDAWTREIWEELRRHGGGITTAEAKRRFGEPKGGTSPALLFARSVKDGWFKHDVWEEETWKGRRRMSHYVALPEPLPKAEERPSYFEGVIRANSVFDYAHRIKILAKAPK